MPRKHPEVRKNKTVGIRCTEQTHQEWDRFLFELHKQKVDAENFLKLAMDEFRLRPEVRPRPRVY